MALTLFLMAQVTLQWVVIGLLVYRLVTGRWPRKSIPPTVVPPAPIPSVEESLPSVLDRLEAKPPVPNWHQYSPQQKQAFAKELAEAGQRLLGR